jgi:hypothetical protein
MSPYKFYTLRIEAATCSGISRHLEPGDPWARPVAGLPGPAGIPPRAGPDRL